MRKTLVISFALRNTYRVNGILYSIKQIPLVGRLLPEKLYSVTALKLLANILSVLWEVVSVFLGKLIYFLTMVLGIGLLYENAPAGGTFLHILLFLTAIGVALPAAAVRDCGRQDDGFGARAAQLRKERQRVQ